MNTGARLTVGNGAGGLGGSGPRAIYHCGGLKGTGWDCPPSQAIYPFTDHSSRPATNPPTHPPNRTLPSGNQFHTHTSTHLPLTKKERNGWLGQTQLDGWRATDNCFKATGSEVTDGGLR